jgi:hypothetical protein
MELHLLREDFLNGRKLIKYKSEKIFFMNSNQVLL